MSKIHRFDCFVVCRNVGDDTEVHLVGASGAALAENVGLIGDLIGGALKRGELAPLPGVALDDIEIERIGQHPDVATGLRIREYGDARAVQRMLGEHLDDILLAHL